MKKKLIMLLALGTCLFISACGNNREEVILNHEEIMEGNLSSISGEYINSEGEVIGNNREEVILNHEEIMEGNLSSISGEYINSEGEVIILESDITDRLLDDVMYIDGFYYMNVLTDDGMYGVGLTIYPVGVSVKGWKLNVGEVILETDETKIRIHFGQDIPMSEQEVFIKSDN